MIHGGNVWHGISPAAWLDYSANIRPEGAPDWVKIALTDAMENLSYYPDPGMQKAKSALAAYLDMPTEYVLPTAGGISAIDLASHLPAECMLQFTPCFVEYAMLGRNRGKIIRNIPLLAGKHLIADPAEKAMDQLTDGCMVWLCNPLNPIGCAFREEQILRLLSLIEEKRGWLIVDEAFIEYCPQHSAMHLIRQHERLLITGSMTKVLGIPGVRLGYLCAQPRILESIASYQLTWELNCFAEAVLCALPNHRAQVLEDCAANARRRTQLKHDLEQLGVFVYPSESAFLLADFGRSVEPIAQALREKGILVRQCMDFDGIHDGNHLRLAVKDEQSNERLIRSLREVMKCAENH